MSNHSETSKKKRVDGQVTGLSGEFFVAGELLKRNLQTSITFGNAKAIDILAHNPETGTSFIVQVKALRVRNFFPLKRASIRVGQIYVFVILNKPGEAVDYFVVPGSVLAEAPGDLARYLDDPKFPGIGWKALLPYKDNWSAFA